MKSEFSFDTFHTKASRIFRVYAIEDFGENQRFIDTSTPFPMGPALKNNFEEVEHMVRIHNISSQVKIGQQLFREQITIAGSNFFKVFDFKVAAGNEVNRFATASDIMITRAVATKYFGASDPIGEILSLRLGDQFEDFTIRAVLENPPSNSSINFYLLINDLNYPTLYSERLLTSSWFNILPETYVLLKEGVDEKELQSKFPVLFKSLLGDDYERSKYFVGLQSLTSIHLDTSFPPAIASVSDPKYSYILGAIATLILFVACINFVTLSIGQSLKRAKEVGIRKVVGAERRQLISQFIGEAVIATMVSLFIGLVLAILNLPMFNDLSGKQLELKPDTFLLIVTLSLTCLIGLFAGSYPAFVLSGFKPISILKGNVKSGDNKQRVRKILVGIQLVLSIFLISTTLFMDQQLSFLQNKNLGFDREQLAVVPLNVSKTGRLGERILAGFEQAKQFKTALNKIPGILNVATSSHDFGNGAWTNIGYTDDKGTYRTFNSNIVDESYLPSLKVKLVAGRNFSEDLPSDEKRSIVVNEAFVKAYGWSDAIGQRIPGKDFVEHEIIGIVEDFNYSSLYTSVEPLVMAMDPSIVFSGSENVNIDNSPMPKLLIRLRSGNIAESLNKIKGVWQTLAAGEEFEFEFVDQALALQYRNDVNLGKIVSSASLIAILIGSLGLYGLASLAMQNRTKEISIRKVMGATERSLLLLLSKEYFYLITISLIISIPLTWYCITQWLASFEYRISITPGVFVFAGGISIFISLITISYQTFKTAWSQPAQTLKHE
jgi:putative ABC transport system permease protein